MALDDLVAIIYQLLPEPHAGLLAGMVFGVKSTLGSDLYAALIRTGTIHIVALSGMNISILSHVILSVLLRFMRRPLACVGSAIITIGFISFVGPSASILRAGLMSILSLFAVVFGKQSWSIYTLILAIMVMLLLNPLWVMDPSFQLSVGATLGIILFARPVQNQNFNTVLHVRNDSWVLRAWHGFRQSIADDLRVTLSAQVFTLPIIVFTFQRISLIAPLSNVLIGFVIPPLTVLGLLIVGVGFVIPILAQPLGWIAWILLSYILFVIDVTSRIPFASIAW